MTTPDYAAEFSLDPQTIYLNHAAVAPWPLRTMRAVTAFAAENATQGALNYPRWNTVEHRLRQRLATLIHAHDANDIALLKSTSEALSFVAYGLDWEHGDNVVIGNQEFPSNRIVWESLAARGVETRQADLSGAASPEDALIACMDERTRVLAVSSVQYATGLKLDLIRLGEYCREHGALFCIDAIQSIGAQQLDVQACHADFVAADGHKWMLGPEGVALFYCRAALRERLRLHEYGWHMVEDIGNYTRTDWTPARSARRFECGSANMLGIHAFDASVSLLLDVGMEVIERCVMENSGYLIDQLNKQHEIELITHASPDRHAGIVTFRPRNGDAAELHAHLMANHIFCAPRGGGIRFSPHFHTPRHQLARAVDVVATYLSR
jgi:selenocysteine lyase/cysteine desulfurase